MNTLNELINHLKKHKDAIIIVGSAINSYDKNYTSEEFNYNYNRKNLKRNPEKLWSFYYNNILTDIDYNDIYDMINKIDYDLLVNQNINGPINNKALNIHGHINKYICPKCKTIYSSNSFEDNTTIPTCEICGKALKPSVLLTGERYDQTEFDNLKQKIINTHSLILIGMDYTEQPLLDLIADYGDIKSQINANGNSEEERVLVAIQNEEEEFDPNQITFCEFLVKDNIEDALTRLLKEY
jgi:NAD-dependent SIR2 family protein deacetylase